jgi:hypothetical protein
MMGEHAYDLVLVNRVLDADGASGVEFIGEIKGTKAGSSVPMMLVSDFPDAQAEAVANGAVQGFGKSALGTPEVAQVLRQILHSGSRAGAEPDEAVPQKG